MAIRQWLLKPELCDLEGRKVNVGAKSIWQAASLRRFVGGRSDQSIRQTRVDDAQKSEFSEQPGVAQAGGLRHIVTVRVIGGTLRGRRLATAQGLSVRPTSDRLRETLFNILSPRVHDSQFLDICAGSGAVAIEALSRGAHTAHLIESARAALSVIDKNLRALEIGTDAAIVVRKDVLVALNDLSRLERRFDLVFFDPPYASSLYNRVLELLSNGNLLLPEAVVVVEHRSKAPPKPEYGNLKLYRELRQGESALAFYKIG